MTLRTTIPAGRVPGDAGRTFAGCTFVVPPVDSRAGYSVARPAPAGLAVRMRIEQLDMADADKIRACHEAALAAQRVDEPESPWFTERPFRGWLTVGWGGDPREVWLAAGRDSVAGWYRLELPDKENLDQANLNLVVHPAERRHGLGLALLRHARRRTGVRCSTAPHVAVARARPSRVRSGRNRGSWTCSACWTSASWKKASSPRYARRPSGRLPVTRWCHGPDWYTTSTSSRRWRSTSRSTTLRMILRSHPSAGTRSGYVSASTTCARTSGCEPTRWRRGMTRPANWRR